MNGKVLWVDDNNDVRAVFCEGLQSHGLKVVPAASVTEALRLISAEDFDALVSDLHLPDAGDGLTVARAMRHLHPDATILVLSGYPALQDAAASLLKEADEVLVKPVGWSEVADIIQKKLSNRSARTVTQKDRVAAIVHREMKSILQDWRTRVESSEELAVVDLEPEERTGHLPQLLSDLVDRLRLRPSAQAPGSSAALAHGVLRRMQSYTVPMVIEESRLLQVCIFNTLQNNLGKVDFSTVLLDVMTIADEVDSQLKQTVLGFTAPMAAMLTN